jgi:hypothetical protein
MKRAPWERVSIYKPYRHYDETEMAELAKNEVNRMNKGDMYWKCPNCGRLISDISFICATTNDLCMCGTQIYRFSWFILDKSDEIVPVDNKETVSEDELDAAYRQGHNDGCVESAQLRAITDIIDTMGAGGESSTPATSDDIGEAYAFNGYANGYSTGHDDGYRAGKHIGYNSGKDEGYAIGYTDCERETHTDVYNAGYADGHRTGSIAGEDEGFEIGYATAREDWRGCCE